MTELREWWVNMHYSDNGRISYAGGHCVSREQAAKNSSAKIRCRIHVRLKPEGAPKRYASRIEQRAWERFPRLMQNGQDDLAYLYCRGMFA